MKKILILGLSIIMLFTYVACSDNENSISSSLDGTSEISIEQSYDETSKIDVSSGEIDLEESSSLDTTSESESIEQPESETSTSDDSSGGLNSNENGGNWTGGAPLS